MNDDANAKDFTQGADRDFVEYIVKQLVNDPNSVVVERAIDEMGVLITLKVSRDDMGRVIGKSGQTAKAIRTLLRIIGSKYNARVNLKIIEPETGEEVTGSSEENFSASPTVEPPDAPIEENIME